MVCSARSSRMEQKWHSEECFEGKLHRPSTHVATETTVSVFLGVLSFPHSHLSPSGHIFSPRTQNHRQKLRYIPIKNRRLINHIGIKCRHDPCRRCAPLQSDSRRRSLHLPIKCGRRTPSMASPPRTPSASMCTTLHRWVTSDPPPWPHCATICSLLSLVDK